MTIFKINRPGAQHWGPPEGKTKERKRYGYGDTIDLPASASTDPKWNNLDLVFAGARDVAAEEAELGQEPATPTIKPAPGDIGADDEHEDKEGDTDEVKAKKAKAKRIRTISKLAKQVGDSNGSSEFTEARKAVIEADLFEADTVPTKKAEVLEALNDLLAAEDKDE